jgi:hypothetical protein
MCPDTSIKRGTDGAVRVRHGVYVTPIYRSPAHTIPMPPWAKPMNVRARITRDLASAVSFCESAGVKLVVHPPLLHMSASCIVCCFGDAPDARFDPPEGEYSPAWSIGCMLHKMITGAPPSPRVMSRSTGRCARSSGAWARRRSPSRTRLVYPHRRARARAQKFPARRSASVSCFARLSRGTRRAGWRAPLAGSCPRSIRYRTETRTLLLPPSHPQRARKKRTGEQNRKAQKNPGVQKGARPVKITKWRR